MDQYIIIIGKSVLSSLDDKILFKKENAASSVEEWLSKRFHARFLRQEKHDYLGVVIVFAADMHPESYRFITIPAAKRVLETMEPGGKEIADLLSDLQPKLNIKLQYGIRDGKVVSISEMRQEERGLNCNCSCPGCGASLVARMGKKKQWHFAHKGEACDIAAAQQTALHILAKEIIEENKKLLFPGITVKRDKYITEEEDSRVKAKVTYSLDFRKASVIECESVTLEKKLSNIIPDVVITAKGRTCLVEIAVTHFVDEEKERKIREIGLPLFEIDLSELYDTAHSREELAKAVLSEPNNRRWIFNPLFDEAGKWAGTKYTEIIESAKKEVEEEDRREAAREERKQQRREHGKRKIREAFEPGNYRKTVSALKNEKKTAEHLKSLHMNLKLDAVPFFLNIPISGEMVFPCDRRIWQSALFDKFIYNRNADGDIKPPVNIKRVQKWIEKYNRQFPIDWNLTYKTSVPISDKEEKTVSLLYDVVVTFFNYLAYLGFVDPFSYQEAAVKQTYSLTPPNSENAAILQEALEKVDWLDPGVDERINQLIASSERGKGFRSGGREREELIERTEGNEPDNPRINWEDRLKEIEKERTIGFTDVQMKDFNGDNPIYDRFSWRWLKCSNCERLFRADQMASYGGRGNINKGICRECGKDRRR